MVVDWKDVLLAYLHDPPDKALSVSASGEIGSHESRRLALAKVLLGDSEVSQKKMKKVAAEVDVMASTVERLPMPKQPHVNLECGRLEIRHPLSGGDPISLQVPELNQSLFEAEKRTLRDIAQDVPGQEEVQAFNRFLAVWRLWPEALGKLDASFTRLPADTRTPDHTIWNHLDTTAAFKVAEAEGHGVALLAFAIGPVQRFIEAARSVRDLWSGSMVLSWLAFRSMLPVIERLGPTALIYPALRGVPLMDLWLCQQEIFKEDDLPEVMLRKAPCIPHRFLALVPWGAGGTTARGVAAMCQQAAAHAWREMADAVRKYIKDHLDELYNGWDKRWESQIGSYFSTSTAVLPLDGSGEEVDKRLVRLLTKSASFADAFPNAEAVRKFALSIPETDRPSYGQGHAGRWQYQVELAGRSLAAARTIRHVPLSATSSAPAERFPQKCTLLGTFEQMGPDELGESRTFWDALCDSPSIDGVRVRPGEALCAVAMVKRFAGPAFLAKQLGLKREDVYFPDTWSIAAAEWLKDAGIDPEEVRQNHDDWNGQWIHWSTGRDDADEPQCPGPVLKDIKQGRDKRGRPPVYYAILKLDGDDLGGWLRGEKSPPVRQVMHPDLVRYYDGLGDAAKAGLDAKRPVGPTLHATISAALANFALHAVPEIVARHHGTTIYSGGDDTLILLPVSGALACALELKKAYTREWYASDGRHYLMMGSRATLSGGLVVVHSKDNLRLALQDARRAEKQAKEGGRNALAITIRRRSGEHTSALCPWDFAPTVECWTQQFRKGASDRWVYHLYTEQATLEQIPLEAIQAEIRRQIDRAEEPTPTLIRPKDVANSFDTYCQSSISTDNSGPRPRFDTVGKALHGFLTLCHTASFLARGRDACTT